MFPLTGSSCGIGCRGLQSSVTILASVQSFLDHVYNVRPFIMHVQYYLCVHLIWYYSHMEKKKRGRPPVTNPANERLPSVRVTPEQLQSYSDAAGARKLSLAGWIKHHLDRAAKRDLKS